MVTKAVVIVGLIISSIAHCSFEKNIPVDPGYAAEVPITSKDAITSHKATSYIFADPDWFQWGGSCTLGEDGKYHLFYARWPRNNPRRMLGWLYESEIARAISDRPEGPYKYVETVLTGPGDIPKGRWDAINAHNPTITHMKDPMSGKMRYYLYFIASRDDNTMSNDWWDHIINQRIGVAISDSPSGPWERHPEPVCVPQGILQKYIVNPGVCQLPDGRFLLLLKGRYSKEKDPNGAVGHMAQGWALSDKPTGPFIIQDTLLFPPTILAEDPCVWVHGSLVYAAVKDWHGKLGGTPGIAWIYGKQQADGNIKWTVPKDCSLTARQINWSDGSITKLDAIERPQILQDKNGKPTHLFSAAGVKHIFQNSTQIPRVGQKPIPIENLPFNLCLELVPKKK